MTANLSIVGQVDIDRRRARKHRNVSEATIAAGLIAKEKGVENGGVIGTKNTQRAELYGWHNPVAAHVDGEGDNPHWMYGLLIAGKCRIACGKEAVSITPGQIFRLNDRQRHWTAGRGVSVCVFVGTFEAPCDDKAIIILERGLSRLENGVRTAPRCGPGFIAMSKEEVWATNDFNRIHLVSRKLADRRGWHIEQCSSCDTRAVEIDNHWPYFSDNRCEKHINGR